MKLQTRITLVFFAIGVAGIILMHSSIFYFASKFTFDDFFDRLEARVKLTAETSIHPNAKSESYREMRNRYLEKLVNERDYVFKIAPQTTDFKKPLPLPDSFYQEILKYGKARYNKQNHFYAGSVFQEADGKYIVIVAASDPYGFQELQELKKILIVTFLIAMLLTYVSGRVFSVYLVKPLRSINANVRNITANNLHLRLPDDRSNDEISELIETFNNMLTRLETAFETQNNFISNASHELRTPLTIISGETQLLLSKASLSEDTRRSARTILAEAEKLENILSSLLGLAQSGFNGQKQNWQKIRIDELVLQVVESVNKIEEQCIIDVDFSNLPEDESLLTTEGNTNLLQLALSNIVLNGCKYSNNQPVNIKIGTENQRIAVSVLDKGIGIPQTEQQHIFEPFFRASNTSRFEGFGIGLPLTLNIIRLHNGSIGIRSEENIGTEMKILLPICS